MSDALINASPNAFPGVDSKENRDVAEAFMIYMRNRRYYSGGDDRWQVTSTLHGS